MWIRLDVGFFEHPKVVEAGTEATMLYLAGLTYCARNMTNGKIPKGILYRLVDYPAWEAKGVSVENEAERLVACGLWEANGVCFVVHDYLKHQASANEMRAIFEARSKAKRDAGALGGKKSGLTRRSNAEARAKQTRSSTEAPNEANAKQNEARLTLTKEILTPPWDPPRGPASQDASPAAALNATEFQSELKLESTPTPTKGKRATQLAEGWKPPAELMAWARDTAGVGDVDAEFEKFCDYHRARGSVMKDWTAAFRNWCRNARDWKRSPPRSGRVPIVQPAASRDAAWRYDTDVEQFVTAEVGHG